MKPEPRPKVFVEAARLIAERQHTYMCYALQAVTSGFAYCHLEVSFLCSYFEKDAREIDDTVTWGDAWSDSSANRRNCRVLALLFCAAICQNP